jgi:hypothetical protein
LEVLSQLEEEPPVPNLVKGLVHIQKERQQPLAHSCRPVVLLQEVEDQEVRRLALPEAHLITGEEVPGGDDVR